MGATRRCGGSSEVFWELGQLAERQVHVATEGVQQNATGVSVNLEENAPTSWRVKSGFDSLTMLQGLNSSTKLQAQSSEASWQQH